MEDRLLLDKVDYKKGTIKINNKVYELNDKNFPTINPENPYELTKEEKETHKEEKNPYYVLIEKEEVCNKILEEFGLEQENSHIINGYILVKEKDGESPIKANGKLLIIDGGFAKSYRKETGRPRIYPNI